MKFFIDTANIEEIKEGLKLGMVDGVTTNPSLIAKEKKGFDVVIKDILKIVKGPVSLEVMSMEAKAMFIEGGNWRVWGIMLSLKCLFPLRD